MLKKAVILAGGKGTRLLGVREDIPKPMMPLAGKPLLAYLINQCVQHGITEIWITVNHLKDAIIQHFGDGKSYGASIQYYEESKPLGTVGGVKALEAELQEDFLVLYGDVMMDMDLHRLYAYHRQKNSDATLVVHPNDHPYDSDLLDMDEDGRVTHFFPKPHAEGFKYRNVVNAATYIFSPTIFKHLQQGVKADFGKDIFPIIVDKLAVFGYNTPEYLKDMGTPGRLQKVEADLLSGKIAARNLHNKQKCIFLDRDGVINYDTDLIKSPEELKLYPFAAETIKKINRSGYLAVVVTNQSVIARGLTDLNGLNEIHKKLETELGEAGAFVDAIYFCPHHPDGGFDGEVPEFKIACACRKPNPGMLLQAAARFNIDLKNSWIIGDSERDVLAGHAAGVTTIGVKTGHGIKKSNVAPHFFMPNLQDAVNFILENKNQQVVAEICAKVVDKKPFVIAIAGNSRSGKSTLSQEIQFALKKQNKKAEIIQLDDWIIPKTERPVELGIFKNYDSLNMAADVAQIVAGKKVVADGYARHPARSRQEAVYHFNTPDVIIIEGVLALNIPSIRDLADFKIFKTIELPILKERFFTFYTWKGLDEKSIAALFDIRTENEYKIVAEDEKFADLVL